MGAPAAILKKVFLVALAIVDDIGAVLVISLFYTSKIGWFALAVAGGFLLLLVALNRAHVRHPLAYTLFGVCL
jgi:NhaA family Na+:H+ antiporter